MNRTWTKEDLDEIEKRISSINDVGEQIIVAFEIRESLPKARAGDYVGAIKWWLNCKIRRLHIKKANQLGTHSLKDELELIIKYDSTCQLCGDKSSPSIDHIVPISKGGSNGVDNLQVLCSSCNSKKRNTWHKE